MALPVFAPLASTIESFSKGLGLSFSSDVDTGGGHDLFVYYNLYWKTETGRHCWIRVYAKDPDLTEAGFTVAAYGSTAWPYDRNRVAWDYQVTDGLERLRHLLEQARRVAEDSDKGHRSAA